MTFHNNKAVFINLGIQEHFNLPKLHSLLHYVSSIYLFGTTDNYNTEQLEHLHIDLAKEAYHTTNCNDKYAQMTMWLEHRDKVQQHSATIGWRQNLGQDVWIWTPIEPLCMCTQSIKIAQTSSRKAIPFVEIFWKYGVPLFQDALADFITGINNSGVGVHILHIHAANTLLPFCTVQVYHNIKFLATTDTQGSEIMDAIHI